MSTLYATFQSAADAEKAAGALIDHGALRRDLTITSQRLSIDSYRRDDEAAVQSGENEGWPVRSVQAVTSERQPIDQNDSQAITGYREADDAEQSAKRGINLTTLDDTVLGALRGSFVGVFFAVIGGIVWISPAHTGAIHFLPALMVCGVLGLTVGAIVGGVIGLLADQGTFRYTRDPRAASARSRQVQLAVDVSSGPAAEDQARRIVSKYNATAIEIS